MDFNNLFSQFGMGSKEIAYLSVTPSVGLELIQLDMVSKSVKNYAFRPLEYNESLRSISNMEEFKTAVQELFNELKMNIKSRIVLNMPMELFGSRELPLLLSDEAITEALTSEVEQSYIFKRYEPVVSWADSSVVQPKDSRKLFYTAIKRNTLEDIKNILSELGATLVSVEMSITSILKALAFSNLAREQMQDDKSWNLMLVNKNGYSICSMVGKNIIDYYEEPLALQSFEGEEIYNAINASAQITLMSYPANSLFIISQTNLVSAELLVERIQTEANVRCFENNEFKKHNIIPVSLEVLEDAAHKISLEAIGIASGEKLPTHFNFIESGSGVLAVDDPNEPIHVELGSLVFDISQNGAKNIATAFAVVILVPALILSLLILPSMKKNNQSRLNGVKSRLAQVEDEIKTLIGNQDNTNFDVNSEIKNVLKNNRAKLMSYSALGDSVPKKLWITYFSAKDDGKFDIKGESTNVEDIYTFYRNMKDSLINTKLRLHKLELKSNSVDDAVTVDVGESGDYQFEITNMTDTELTLPTSGATSTSTPPTNTSQAGAPEQKAR